MENENLHTNPQSFGKDFWNNRWTTGETGWDTGGATPPLADFIRWLPSADLRILIPGAGNAYEGILLHQLGFSRTHILDITALPLETIKKNNPEIPSSALLCCDFFTHTGEYDLILEQTFFCALHPVLRRKYFEKCHSLLSAEGMVAGVLFNDVLNTDHPPFGGSATEYRNYFSDLFKEITYEPCFNSIPPRAGREWFIRLQKK